MNYDELKEQYGTAEEAAKQIAEGHHEFNDNDYMSWPEPFRSLIIFVQNRMSLDKSH